MKHGIKFRKLQRTPSHRAALLRNLVSALLHHEQIQTTVPKAKEAARLAEKMITLGKRGGHQALRSAQGFLYPGHHFGAPSTPLVNPPVPSGIASSTSPEPLDNRSTTSLLPKLFTSLATRYAARPGGYTRITKFGARDGDHAPNCVLSLVDGPRDLEWEMAARTVGREVYEMRVRSGAGAGMGAGVGEGTVDAVRAVVSSALHRAGRELGGPALSSETRRAAWDGLRPHTKETVEKVLRYREVDEVESWIRRTVAYAEALRIAPEALQALIPDTAAAPRNRPYSLTKPALLQPAGTRVPGSLASEAGLGLAKGSLRHDWRMAEGQRRAGAANWLGKGPIRRGDSLPERQSLAA